MDDAIETFVTVLNYIHEVINGGREVCSPPCFVHKIFGINSFERFECQCGATSEPLPSSSFIYHVYTSELRLANTKYPNMPFDKLLAVVTNAEKKKCPERHCSIMNSVHKVLIETIPEVFTVSLVWSSSTPSPNDIKLVLDIVSRSINIDLTHIFYTSITSMNLKFTLRGMICYYRMHYLAYFWSQILNEWLIFDDTNIQRIGDWDAVRNTCVAGQTLPALLFYESINCTPSSESLPRHTSSLSVTTTPPPSSSLSPLQQNVNVSELSQQTTNSPSSVLTFISPYQPLPSLPPPSSITRSSPPSTSPPTRSISPPKLFNSSHPQTTTTITTTTANFNTQNTSDSRESSDLRNVISGRKSTILNPKFDVRITSQTKIKREFIITSEEFQLPFIQRQFEAFGIYWRLYLELLKSKKSKHKPVRIERLLTTPTNSDTSQSSLRTLSLSSDSIQKCSITLNIKVEVSAPPFSFTSSQKNVVLNPGGHYEDPYFLCPKRYQILVQQRQFGLCVTFTKI